MIGVIVGLFGVLCFWLGSRLSPSLPHHLFARQREWSLATFGDRGPLGPLRHLAKEVEETVAAPDDVEEYADMQILLWDALWRAGYELDDLYDAVVAKAAKNRGRRWGAMDPNDIDQPVEHVE